MFQYALYLSLKKKYPKEKIKIDISMFETYGLHNGFELKRIFDIDAEYASREEIRELSFYIKIYKLQRIFRKIFPVRKTECVEKYDFKFMSEVWSNCDRYYEGYWQSPLYFDEIEQEIKKMFIFPKPIGGNKKIEEIMKTVNSVSIHVRRGDYLNAKSFMGICELDYYEKAIEYINSEIKDPYFFIFSNDIKWCEENLRQFLKTDKLMFISNNVGKESYWDMYLMSCCNNMILANSSFSWWAAYLNKNKEAKVLAPKKWVNRDYETQIHLDSWKKI